MYICTYMDTYKHLKKICRWNLSASLTTIKYIEYCNTCLIPTTKIHFVGDWRILNTLCEK